MGKSPHGTRDWMETIGHKGKLHRALGIKPGHKIPEAELVAAAHHVGLLGKEARAAENMEKSRRK